MAAVVPPARFFCDGCLKGIPNNALRYHGSFFAAFLGFVDPQAIIACDNDKLEDYDLCQKCFDNGVYFDKLVEASDFYAEPGREDCVFSQLNI